MESMIFVTSSTIVGVTAALFGEALTRKNYPFATFLGTCCVGMITLYNVFI